ncbi:MAG: ATP-binding protein [Kiritimatiellia bacterium]
MIQRDLMTALRQAAADYPVVTLTGPRQSGKTTLVKTCFPGHAYANLEQPDLRKLAQDDPHGFFVRFPPPVILDEIQRVPELASYVQVAVDGDRRAKGRYILTGSHQTNLHQAVSQSLAGRTAVLRLLPLSLKEVATQARLPGVDELLWRGFMPALYEEPVDPTGYHRNYFQTYVEKDVRQLLQIRNLHAFERFMTLLAGRVGQIVNLSALSGETGVSSTTLGEWLSILEASFVVFRLHPYFANIGKRVVKSPKLYFTEVGLATYLLGIESPAQMTRDPLRGGLFENMVVSDLLKTRLNQGRDPGLFFLRDNKGFEIDLIVKEGRHLIPVEIKSSMTFQPDFIRPLRDFCSREKTAHAPALVYAGEPFPDVHGVRCVNFQEAYRLV